MFERSQDGMPAEGARGILGVDIDNVISLTDDAMRGIFRDICGVRLEQDQIVHYQYHRCGVTPEQERTALEVFRDGACSELKVVPGAIESLRLLQSRYRLVLVTSRTPIIREKTQDWLRAQDIPHDELVFESAKHETGHGFDFFIEDNGEFAVSLAEAEISTFLFDYPWNQWVEAHPKIARVSGWRDVLAKIM